jgi:hypothetical protein
MVHNFISLMIKNYDAKVLYDQSPQNKELADKYFELRREMLKTKIDNIHLKQLRGDSEFKYLIFGKSRSNAEQREVPHIELLKRLEKNTRPSTVIPDNVIDKKLSILIKKQLLNEKNPGDIIRIVEYLNEKLSSYIRTNKIGMDVNEVLCINRIDHLLTEYMKKTTISMSFLKSTIFLKIFKFWWITNSVDFSEEKFNDFKHKIEQSKTTQEIKNIVGNITVKTISDLGNSYKIS